MLVLCKTNEEWKEWWGWSPTESLLTGKIWRKSIVTKSIWLSQKNKTKQNKKPQTNNNKKQLLKEQIKTETGKIG